MKNEINLKSVKVNVVGSVKGHTFEVIHSSDEGWKIDISKKSVGAYFGKKINNWTDLDAASFAEFETWVAEIHESITDLAMAIRTYEDEFHLYNEDEYGEVEETQ